MKSVVVGGSGFLGGAVVDELVCLGRDVVLLDVAGSQARTDRRHGRGAARFVHGDVRHVDTVMAVFDGAEEVYDFAGVLGTPSSTTRFPRPS